MLRHMSVVLALLLPFAFVANTSAQGNVKDPDTIRIGMNQSLFVDVSPVLVRLFAPSFNELCKVCTGLPTEMVIAGDPFATTKQVQTGALHFGIYQGVEYGWAAQKNPGLTPLMVAVNQHPNIRAHLVVRKDSNAAGFADLKGKDVALPRKSKEHCRLFLERNCAECGQCDPKTLFNELTRPSGTEAALDDVCTGKVAGAIVEQVAWEAYLALKPGCAARLKLAKTSERFPMGVIAYQKGLVSDLVLTKFKEGMMAANKNDRTREMMNMYQITAFENVPPDYAQTCADIVKAYPAPEVK